MNIIEMSVSRDLQSPAHFIYAIVTDFLEHHLQVAPSSVHNTTHRLIEGGSGAGTIVDFKSSIGPEPQPVTYHVTEPGPGRLMIMKSPNESIVQTFEISSDDLDRCTFRLSIRCPQRPSLLGLVDRVTGPMGIERLLEQKLDNIALYAATLGANVR